MEQNQSEYAARYRGLLEEVLDLTEQVRRIWTDPAGIQMTDYLIRLSGEMEDTLHRMTQI